MSGFPPGLRELLPASTIATWTAVAPLVPAGGYLAGGTALTVHLLHRVSRDLDFFLPSAFDPEALAGILERAGTFEATQLEEGTLNGIFEGTKVQFLEATTQHQLDPTIPTAGVEVAGLRDLFAMKLKVIADRGELRDYFDLLTLERRTDLRAETILPLFVERYRPRIPRQAVATIVLGLGYLGDVGDDPTLPLSRSDIEAYWQHRQPQIGQAIHHEAP